MALVLIYHLKLPGVLRDKAVDRPRELVSRTVVFQPRYEPNESEGKGSLDVGLYGLVVLGSGWRLVVLCLLYDFRLGLHLSLFNICVSVHIREGIVAAF